MPPSLLLGDTLESRSHSMAYYVTLTLKTLNQYGYHNLELIYQGDFNYINSRVFTMES